MRRRKKRRMWILSAAAAIGACCIAALSSAAAVPCEDCGKLHTQVQGSRLTATCTEDAYIDYHCPDCGHDWREVIEAAAGHSLVARDIIREATCTEEGIQRYACSAAGCTYAEENSIARTAHATEKVPAEPAGCETSGLLPHYRCSECGGTYADAACTEALDPETAPAGHEWETHTTAATCTEDGYAERVCTVCGKSSGPEDLVPAVGHELTQKSGIDASCTQEGRRDTYSCAVCGGVYLDSTGQQKADEDNAKIPARGHKLERSAGAEPACTESGEREHWTCRVCGGIYADRDGRTELDDPEIPAAGHDLSHESGKDAGCETDGSREYWECRTCGKIYLDAEARESVTFAATRIAALGHDLEHMEERPAEEDADGHCEHWRCRRCGKLYADSNGAEEVAPVDVYIPAAGHTIRSVPESAPTCTEAGVRAHYECTTCGGLYEDEDGTQVISQEILRIPPTGHDETEHVTEATCTEPGRIKHVCTRCGDAWCEETAPLGHDMEQIDAAPVDENTDGSLEHWRCRRCGRLYADSAGKDEVTSEAVRIPATGHTLSSIPETAATCTDAGIMAHYECTSCGALYEDEVGTQETTLAALKIPPKGHDETEHVTDATCTEPGRIDYACDRCGDVRSDETAPLGHDMEHIEAVPASEDADGQREHWRCRRCGMMYLDSAGQDEMTAEDVRIPATGHSIHPVPAAAPTCTEAGQREHYACITCGRLYEDEDGTRETSLESLQIPAMGHAYVDTVTDPDCISAGHTEHICTVCQDSYVDGDTPALGHSMTRYPPQAPTLTRDGNVEYWKCDRCGKYYLDAGGEHEVQPADVVRPRLDKDPGGPDVETGDRADIWVYAVLAAVAAAVMGTAVWMRSAARRRCSRR